MNNCKKSPLYKGKKKKTWAFCKKQKRREYGKAGSNELVVVNWTKAGFQRAFSFRMSFLSDMYKEKGLENTLFT